MFLKCEHFGPYRLLSLQSDQKLLLCGNGKGGEIAWCQPGREYGGQGWYQRCLLSHSDVRNHRGPEPSANALCRV